MNSTSARPNYVVLRFALLVNAGFSVLSGFAMLILSTSLAHSLGAGIPAPVIIAVGMVLIPFGGITGRIGTRHTPSTVLALLISVVDLAWVIGSAALVAFAHNGLSNIGIGMVSTVALIVFGFAMGQLHGIARVYRPAAADPRRIRVCIQIRTGGDAEIIWRNVADMGNIARFATTLATSAMRHGNVPGVGAVRECSDRSRRRWAERCLRLDDAHRELEVEFLADEPEFPFPFHALRGGWRVQSESDSTAVTIWWEGTLRHAILASTIPALFDWQAQRQFAVVVRRMAASKSPQGGAMPSLLSVVPC